MCTFGADSQVFFIKVFMQNDSVLDVRTTDFEEMGYNLKKDDWLNNFTEDKDQATKEDGMPLRGACEKRHEFFSILFSTLTEKDDIVMDWQCGVGLFIIFVCFGV